MKQALRREPSRISQATGGLAGAAPLASAQTAKAKSILITSGGGRLAQALAAGLKETWSIRLTERAPVRTEHEFVECALGHDSRYQERGSGRGGDRACCRTSARGNAEQQIDLLTRCTYNLLWAAAEEKVPRIVFLSTLELMTGYEPKLHRQRELAAASVEDDDRDGEAPGRVHQSRVRARGQDSNRGVASGQSSTGRARSRTNPPTLSGWRSATWCTQSHAL